MRRLLVLTSIYLASAPAMAQQSQTAVLQQQVDSAMGQISRTVGNMANLIMQQAAQIEEMKAQIPQPKQPEVAIPPAARGHTVPAVPAEPPAAQK